MFGRNWQVELLPILLHDVLQVVVEGIRAKELPEVVGSPGLKIHDLGND